MNIVADQYHPAILYVFLHCSPETTLRIFRELVCLVYDQNLESLSTLGFDVSIGGYFFHDVLNDMPVVVLIVRRCHFNVVVACEDTVFDCCGCVFRFEDSLLFLEFENVVSEYFGNEGVGSCLFASSIGAVKDHMLHNNWLTGKSEVLASCSST